jgi:hypothetical protein
MGNAHIGVRIHSFIHIICSPNIPCETTIRVSTKSYALALILIVYLVYGTNVLILAASNKLIAASLELRFRTIKLPILSFGRSRLSCLTYVRRSAKPTSTMSS